MPYYTLDLSLRDTSRSAGNQLVDTRILLSVGVRLNEMIQTWNRRDQMAQLRLSEVEVTGAGAHVYYANTRYVRGDAPPDSLAKRVEVVHLGEAYAAIIHELHDEMLLYELKKRELQQQLHDLRDETNAAGFDCFRQICDLFNVAKKD